MLWSVAVKEVSRCGYIVSKAYENDANNPLVLSHVLQVKNHYTLYCGARWSCRHANIDQKTLRRRTA